MVNFAITDSGHNANVVDLHALALVFRTIRRILEAIDLAPVVRICLLFKVGGGEADLRSDDKRVPTFGRVFKVDGVGELLDAVDGRVRIWRIGASGGVDGDVAAVAESFLRSAAHAFRSVLAFTPSVSGVVCPL